jgi:hypothetical protein
MMLHKILPLACLMASASSFPVVPMLTGVRAPAHDSGNLASARHVAGTVYLLTPAAPLLRKGRASLDVKMVAASSVTAGNVPLTGSTLEV